MRYPAIRNLGRKWRSGAIPNLGAGHEIKPQPGFLFAMWTCRFASQPPCHRRVPGRRLRKETAPPTQNFWPSLNLKEQQSNLVRGNRPITSYEGSTDLIFGIHLDRIMKAWWDKAPCQLRNWETRELRPPGTAIRNKGGTNL
jgi:hypothetical protein